MALSNKQKLFINAYLRLWNATQAALEAGYSEHSARVIGSENLTKPDISSEIQRRVAEKTLTADEVLVRLAEEARGDVGEFLGLSVDDIKKTGNTRLIKKVSQTKTVSTSKNGTVTESESTTLEMYDAQSALVQIGKHHKLFTEKVEHDGETTLRVVYVNGGTDNKAT